MLSGRRLDLLDPSPLDVEIVDIAHGLARVPRWNGQTRGDAVFSVAQHTLVVDDILIGMRPGAAATTRLAVMLHDAPEYVIGDLISPFKALLGGEYVAVEQRLLAAIHLRFGLPHPLPKTVTSAVKAADRVSAFHEATQLAGFTHAEARRYFGRPPRHGPAPALEPWPAPQAEAAFLDRFHAIVDLTEDHP